jgi:ABC-type antimicrobial peptide transport system permease subunit
VTFKLALKNISSKPWRAVATIFVVAVAVSLIFAMLSFADGVYEYLFQVETAGSGASDITIKTNSTSDRITGKDGLEDVEGVDKVVPTLNLYGLYQNQYVSLRGFDKGDYETLSQIQLVEGNIADMDSNTDNVVISESMAEEYSLNVGAQLAIISGGKTINFYVVGVAKESGYFLQNTPYTIIGNVKGVSRLIFGEQAIYNEIYLIVKDGYSIEKVIDNVKAIDKFGKMSVTPSQDVDYIQNHTDSMSAPVVIAGLGVYVLAMAFVVLIAFTSLTERKKLVAKLTMVGATKSQILFTFLWEVLLLAFGGAVVGSILAGGVFALLLKVTLSSTIAFSISPLKLFGASAIGFITAVLATIIPIASAMRSTIRANENEKSKKSVVAIALPIALVLVAVASVIVEFTAKGGKGALSLVNLVLVFVFGI